MGRFKKRKTGRRQRGKGTEQSIHFDALLFYFRLEQAESKTNVRRFELGRSTSLMRGDLTTVLYCRVGFDSEVWSVSQGSECLWIQVARAKWLHPGAAACNRSGNNLREYNKVQSRSPPWPTALITSTLNLEIISKRHHKPRFEGRYSICAIVRPRNQYWQDRVQHHFNLHYLDTFDHKEHGWKNVSTT